MRTFIRWLLSLFSHRKPQPLTKPTVGVVCHRVNEVDIAALRAMGVRHVRLSLYPDGDGAQHIDAALAGGLEVLAVSYRAPEYRAHDALRWPMVLWQVGNEPNWPTVTPQQAAERTWGGDVSSGIAHGTPTAWIVEFARLCSSLRLACHIYGQPLSAAVAPTLAQFPWAGTWVTEIGDKSAGELEKALRLIDGAKYPRVYVYALWSEGDGYTLTPAHQQVIRGFIAS